MTINELKQQKVDWASSLVGPERKRWLDFFEAHFTNPETDLHYQRVVDGELTPLY